MKEVVLKEIIKLRMARIIYLVLVSKRVSPIHVVSEKTDMKIVENDKCEIVPTRIENKSKMYIDYWKLNEVTKKDNFSIHFLDQMVEYGSPKNHFSTFWKFFLGFYQIPIAQEDQEKTIFTCTYGTYAFIGLCNALSTFQRCMMSIYFDFINKCIGVFMDDFSIYEDSFHNCFHNLGLITKRCKYRNQFGS